MKRFSPLALSLTLASAASVLTATSTWAQESASEALPAINVSADGVSNDSARKRTASIASFDDSPLLDTPTSVNVVNATQIKDQQARLLSDVIKNDASIGENYAPVGYYENIIMRGFALDPASAYRINGLSVAGEQNVALENKEQVEFLNGLAGLQGGVMSAGGMVNYVTKRPAEVRSVVLSTDSNGSRYVAADVGTLFGEQKQFGIRINAAHEDIHSYVNGSDGYRDFASLAASWAISAKTSLQINGEYQQKSQKSVAGYQLLGGTTLPATVSPSTMLTPQTWAQPVKINSTNLDARLDHEFNDDWRGYLQIGRSRTVIDDYIAFPYGSGGGSSPYFAANGDFDVYDFRSPDDTRRNDEGKAVLLGKFDTGSIRHDLTIGLDMSRRVVDKSDGISVLVGSDNIYNPNPVALNAATDAIPAAYRNLDSRQQAIFFTDKISLNDRWQLVGGGREIWLKEQTYDSTGALTRDTRRNMFLPQLALIFKPQTNMSLYGSYAETLTSGTAASLWDTNYGSTLPPSVAHQLETGIKYDLSKDLSLTAALFRLSKAYEYPQPNADGTLTYVQQGTQVNQGLELGAAGKLTRQLNIGVSVAFTQAHAHDTGTAAYDGKQAINVPLLRSAVNADYAVASLPGLNLQGSWLYSGRKSVIRDDSVEVPAYHIFNVGLRYATRIGGHPTTLRLNIDNLFDKRYWKDSGEYLGDSYLFPGAPRVARLSVQYDF